MTCIRINLMLCNSEICILRDDNKMAVKKICICVTGTGTLSLHPLGQCGFQFPVVSSLIMEDGLRMFLCV